MMSFSKNKELDWVDVNIYAFTKGKPVRSYVHIRSTGTRNIASNISTGESLGAVAMGGLYY
jgi:hypothetical protein